MAAEEAAAAGRPAQRRLHAHTRRRAEGRHPPAHLRRGRGDGVVRVVVKYKGPGMTSWKRFDLKKVGDGWGGLVPCADVKTGTLRYYIQGLDELEGVRRQQRGLAPPLHRRDQGRHLGRRAASARHEAPQVVPRVERLPAGLPGMLEERRIGGRRAATRTGTDKDDDQARSGPFKRVWIGMAGAIDFQSMPEGQDLCRLDPITALPSNSANVYCTNSDGTDFPSRSNLRAEQRPVSRVRPAARTAASSAATSASCSRSTTPSTRTCWSAARLGMTLFKYPGEAAYQRRSRVERRERAPLSRRAVHLPLR